MDGRNSFPSWIYIKGWGKMPWPQYQPRTLFQNCIMWEKRSRTYRGFFLIKLTNSYAIVDKYAGRQVRTD